MYKSIKELSHFYEGVEREVYLDLENSTPLPKEVLDAMLPYFNEAGYGHPSITHRYGWEAYEAIMSAASYLADIINAREAERINFTPGETEANNLALIGVAFANRDRGRRVVISEIEPLNIVNVSSILYKLGFEVVRIPVDSLGFIDLDALSNAISKDTVLVSINMVNHEIGTIEPIKEAVEIVKDRNPDTYFHSDASDAFGRMRVDVSKLGIDLMTISSYKILGPRGVGALYVGEGVKIERILEGQIGTQYLWPGTENTPLIVGFRKAAELAYDNLDKNVIHMRGLRDRLIKGILDNIDNTILNGPEGDKRSPDNVNISFLYCEGEALTIELSMYGVYVSSGSACTRRILEPSHVMTAIGREYEAAHGSILMKVSRYHSKDDIEYVLSVIPKAVSRLRSISPVKEAGKYV
jgi:cysteine desulfurase